MRVVPLADALASAAAAGDFFRLPVDPDGPGWRPFTDLVQRPEVLAERVAAGRVVLAGFARVPVDQVELRATASVVFLGLAARLTTPVLGAAVLSGTVPLPAAPDLRWRPAPNGSTELGIGSGSPTGSGDEPERAALLADWLREGPVSSLLDAFRTGFRISGRLLLGNVASGVGGAVSMLAAVAADGEQAAAADSLGRRLLALPPLAGSTRPSAERPGRVLGRPGRRLSCCLYYRLPGAELCADCVLDRVPRPSG